MYLMLSPSVMIGQSVFKYSYKKKDMTNKQAFIECLTTYMNSRNIAAFQSTVDADTLLVSTAIAACSSHNVAVIGEDTDILILVIHHYVILRILLILKKH